MQDVFPEFIENRLAERGILLPEAWNHIYERAHRGIKVNVDYLLDKAAKQTNTSFDESKLPLTDRLMDFCQQKGFIPAKYPPPQGSSAEIASAYSKLDAFSQLFTHGARSDLKKVSNGNDIPVDFFGLGIGQIITAAKGDDKMTLLAGQAEQAETKEGEIGFFMGAALRSLLTPINKELYSVRDIIYRIENTIDNLAFSHDLLKTVIDTLANTRDLNRDHPLLEVFADNYWADLNDVVEETFPGR